MRVFRNEEEYLLHLIRSVMNDRVPDDIPDYIDIKRLFKISCAHQVENLAYYGIEKLGKKIQKWEDIRDLYIVKDITQQTELEAISGALADAKIRHIPLKGSNLKFLYPQTDFRTMSDLDILIDPENADLVKGILEKMDYVTVSFGEHIHDVYQKEPVMNVEIHRELFDYTNPEFRRGFGSSGEGFRSSFDGGSGGSFRSSFDGGSGGSFAGGLGSVFEKCREISEFRFQMDLEYDLAYILAHLSKHYRNGGTGIRSFLDLWVYLKRYHSEIDYSKLNRILDDMNFKNEAYTYLNLSLVLFGSKPSNKRYDAMIAYVFRAGAYGSVSMKVENDIRRNGRFYYLLRQLFPRVRDMEHTYPILRKHIYFLPMCYMYRLCVGSFKGWDYTKRKLEGIFK